MSFGWTLAAVAALAGLQAPAIRAQAPDHRSSRRQLANAAEVYGEIKPAPGTEMALKDQLLSFFDYQDLALYHPRFGYYSSGRVSFVDDYQTFPNVLAPYFGQMVAEQILRMWDGMRRAGTLTPTEPFTVAEFGAGNGALAESILDYIDTQARSGPDPRWRAFAQQAIYVCYDRSAAMRQAQQKRNARFGGHFESREGDATDPTSTIPAGSLKGVILSNELPDVFAVHKVILSPSGMAEVAFVAPVLSGGVWNALKKRLPLTVQASVARDSGIVRKLLSRSGPSAAIYLSRATFTALLEALVSSGDYELRVRSIQFHEVYAPVGVFPELAQHLRRYARDYALELARLERARSDKGMVTYINLGEESFIRGMGRILGAGYVMTIDYGDNWDGMMDPGASPHLRTYGPGNELKVFASHGGSTFEELAVSINQGRDEQAESARMELAAAARLDDGGEDRKYPGPYFWPTLNDITTDVNFSYLASEGRSVGLKTVFFGPQAALQTGTTVSLRSNEQKKFRIWAGNFLTDGAFKLLVQQKENTDPSYKYPDSGAEPLDVDEKDLSPAQRKRAAGIENRLTRY